MLPSPLVGEGKGEGDVKDKTLIIRFKYRELTDKEVRHYEVEGGSNTSKQEKINQKSYEEVLKKVKNVELRACLGKEYKPILSKSEGTAKPLLLYQISRFASKNTKDYFIHKNLKKFLSEQLDYFIKAEVLSIETLEKESFLDKHITRAKVVREIGEDIVDFLSQIEDFQKRLWEKKKFVLKTEYVITTDRIFSLCRSDPEPSTSVIPSDSEESQSIVQGKLRKVDESHEYFYDEIWKNKEQKKEWKDLGFDVPKNKEELKKIKLPIDTKYFSQEFKEKLLETLTSSPVIARDKVPKQSHDIALDDLLDGLLIKSDNWQALNLLLGKYKEKVQTVYIDPPFNLGTNADFLYNVNYKDSSWISILENRLLLARNLLDNKGSMVVRCDYNGNMFVRLLMNEIFGDGNFRNELSINKSNIKGPIERRFNPALETLYFYTKTEACLIKPQFKKREKESQWLDMHSPKENKARNSIIIYNEEFIAPKSRHWTFSQDKVNELIKADRIRIIVKEYIDVFGKKHPRMPQYFMSHEVVVDSNFTDIPGYSSGWQFQTENSEILLKRLIEALSDKENFVLDFFLGSGTTTAVAHKLKRKWLGVEMGEHFWTVVLPRMKRVLAYDKSGISKEADVKDKYNEKTAGGFFKYQILEQYEDTLDNIELTPNKQAELKFRDDYLLKYYLDYETRGNPSLLNIEMLKNPFAYKLRVNPEEAGEPQEMIIDIPETFNYLLGLKVKKIKARTLKCHPELVSGSKGMLKQVQHDKHLKRKYLFILGEKEGKDIAIVWRDYEPSLRRDEGWSEEDFKRDKEFIIKELASWTPHIVYVNGQSVLTPKLGETQVEIRSIEPEFKRLME